MNRLFMAVVAIISTVSASAQLPKWVIEPVNDTIFMKIDNKLFQTVKDDLSALWTIDGNQLFYTNQDIMPFKNGVATVMIPGYEMAVGVVDEKGNFVELPNLLIPFNHPYFEDEYILAFVDKKFEYHGKNGKKAEFPENVKAYPFHNGLASYFTYENLDKAKDPHFNYYRADQQTQTFNIHNNGKIKHIEPTEIEFLSSINEEGKGIAVIKNKFYWFVPETNTFEPLLLGDEEQEKNRQLKTAEDYSQFFTNLPMDSVRLTAKYGKKNYATLKFDPQLRPVSITYDEEVLEFKKPTPEALKHSSNLSKYGDELWGLSLDRKKVLPEQFQQVGLMYGNNALVKSDGKWGVIQIIPDANYSLKVNKGEDVAFRHQKYESQLRLDLPPAVSARNVKIDIEDESGLSIDRTSRETKDTDSGNFVIYTCTLNIPDSLPDVLTTINYKPVKISYDGISLFDTEIPVKAWHLKYYNVDPIESETTINDGVVSFTFNINAQRIIGEGDYPFDVKYDSDNLIITFEKLSETRYKCTITNLMEGNNNLNIIVKEKGCPPSVFPFDIEYTKPAPKSKKKEAVVVKKKTPSEAKPAIKMEL